MKLVVANAWGERLGGAENHLWTLLRHLDTDRVEPVVIFLAPGTFHDEVAALGIRTELLPTRRVRHGGRFVRTARALRSLLRDERPDVTLGWGPKPQLYLGPVSASIGRAQRNVWMLPEVPGHPVHRIAARLPAAAVMCPSNFLRDRLANVAPSREAFVVHSGIELRPIPPRDEHEALRERLGIPPERTIVGMVARLAPVKGQDRLLRAAAVALQHGLDLQVLLVGGDAHGLAPHYEQKLRRLVSELGLEDRVTFTGHRPDPYAELSLFDVFVSAASEDGFPMAPLEAMAVGIPVVAVNAGGPSEMIEHGRSGYLVESEDPHDLARALECVTADEGLWRRLVEGGRERVRERFTAERMANELTVRLEEVARGDGR